MVNPSQLRWRRFSRKSLLWRNTLSTCLFFLFWILTAISLHLQIDVKSVKESTIMIWPWWWEQLRVMKVCKLWLQAKNAMSILCNTVSCPAWSVPSLGVAVPACAFAKPMIVLTPLNTIRGEDNEGSIARDLKCTALYEKRPWRRASVTYLGTLRWRLP